MIASGRINRQQPQQFSSSDVPYTIQRLMNLWQGREMVYYKGHFDADIAACTPVRRNQGTSHAAILRSVRGAARDLAAQGRIILLERTAERYHPKGNVNVTEYVAIGNV